MGEPTARGPASRLVPRPEPDGTVSAEKLLDAIALGDKQAFEHLYELVSTPLFGLIQRIVRDTVHSEEVTQEVLLEVWRTAERYHVERGSAMVWILTLGHRQAVDRVRSVQASRNRECRVGAGQYRRPFDEACELVIARYEQRQLRHCLGTSSDLQREAVMLIYYRGHTPRQAAHVLATPVSTVKTRLRDGLLRLRAELKNGAEA